MRAALVWPLRGITPLVYTGIMINDKFFFSGQLLTIMIKLYTVYVNYNVELLQFKIVMYMVHVVHYVLQSYQKVNCDRIW